MKKLPALTNREQLQERSDYLKYFASKKSYLKYLKALNTNTIKPRKGFYSKLLGNVKSVISNNLINL